MELKAILELEDRYQLSTYSKLPISLERGRGSYVFDSDGKRYLDMYGGHAVASTGHCHPEVVRAIQEQAESIIFYSNVVYHSARSRAAAKLIDLAGAPYHQAFFANSGSEANENALKLARAVTGRVEVLSTTGSFHGRTYGSLSATGIDSYRNYLNAPVPGHRILPWDRVADEVSTSTAAVLLEPIQSMSGVIELPVEALQAIYGACRKNGAVLIFDEIQTGIGRTGTFLYANQLNIRPDLISLAKGIASGFPVGALLVSEKIAKQVRKGDLGTTFGGGPLACAAMEATLKVIEQEDLPANAHLMGLKIVDGLRRLEVVEEVRGQGLLLGIRFRNRSASEVHRFLFERGILSGTSDDPSILRIMPPLTLSSAEVEEFSSALESL